MKSLRWLLILLGILLLSLLVLWVAYPSDPTAGAFVGAWCGCLGGAAAAVLIYLGIVLGQSGAPSAPPEPPPEPDRDQLTEQLRSMDARLADMQRRLEELGGEGAVSKLNTEEHDDE